MADFEVSAWCQFEGVAVDIEEGGAPRVRIDVGGAVVWLEMDEARACCNQLAAAIAKAETMVDADGALIDPP